MHLSWNDCNEILKAKFISVNYKPLNFELAPFGDEKLGFMCDHNILTIDVLLGNQVVCERFFVKNLPADEERRKFCLETSAHFKEEQMFAKMLPTFLKYGLNIISECTPQCYLIKPDDFIVMEDLTTKGYKMLPARKFLEYAEVKTALKSVAKFHACGFILEEKLAEMSRSTYRMYDHFREEFKESFYSNSKSCVEYLKSVKINISAQIDLFTDDQPCKISGRSFKEYVGKILDGFADLVKPSPTFRNTICHGDLWANNLLFKFENEDSIHCVLIDFQGYRYCPPAQDVMAFLYFTTSNDFRSKHLYEILDFYYEELGKRLRDCNADVERIISRDDFAESCKYYEVFGAAQAMREFQNIMLEPKVIKKILEMPDGTENMFSGDRSSVFLEMCEKDAVYREKQREAMEGLRILFEKEHLSKEIK